MTHYDRLTMITTDTHIGIHWHMAEEAGFGYLRQPFSAAGTAEVNANHLRSTTSGWVTGTARPLHVGRTTHVWQIELLNEFGQRTCISRITMAILPPREEPS